MKNSTQIVISILIVVALLVLAGAVCFFLGVLPEAASNEGSTETTTEGNTGEKGVTILDARGEKMIVADTVAGIYDSEYWAYLEIVISEAEEILAKQENCKASEARSLLFTKGYQIYTAFDPTAYEALSAVEFLWEETCNTACAITDLQGGLLAVYSADVSGKQINYAQERRSPYSSFKALSVYTPAIEKGVANWSTMYPDTPYKQLADENGQLRDWPANATGVYSQENLPVYEACASRSIRWR